MAKTAELGKLPSIESYSGRHFGFQSQREGEEASRVKTHYCTAPFFWATKRPLPRFTVTLTT